jgi:DNA-binding NarL/FixJ family response regulator
MKAKVLIVDDHQLFIEGLMSIFRSFNFIEDVIYKTDVNQLNQTISQFNPDLLLLDINIHGQNGLEIGKQLKVKIPKLKIIIISMHNHPALIQKAQKYGFSAYLCKDISTSELRETLQLILEGKIWNWNSDENIINEDKFLKNSFNITSRELEIIHYLARGLDNEEISEKLFLSYHTIKTHRKNIYMKLQISNLTQLTLFAQNQGI